MDEIASRAHYMRYRFHKTYLVGTIRYLRMIIFLATVCKTVRPMPSVRCLSVLFVTLVHCGQTVGWIKMNLGMQVSLGLGHFV